jgi:hypothetical protein
MSNDPKTSVVNQYCQAHDVPNIFVTDGACWVFKRLPEPHPRQDGHHRTLRRLYPPRIRKGNGMADDSRQ